MLGKAMDAAQAAYEVGYESPSQFSREYRRLFGNPPAHDIAHLKDSRTATGHHGDTEDRELLLVRRATR